MKKKYALTLLEIMIVIFLIGLIGSVIGYNMKGSLDEGRAFKTTQAKEQIYDILMLQIAEGATAEEVVKNPEHYLKRSGMVKKPENMIKDGWGVPFEITQKGNADITIKSKALQNYLAKKGKASNVAVQESNEEEKE